MSGHVKKSPQIVGLIVVSSILISSISYAFIYEGETQNVSQTIVRSWLSGWANRVEIAIDHTAVTSDLTNFPVLLHLSSSSGIGGKDVTFVFNEVGSNRQKIAVTTSDNDTQCYVETEKWVYPLSSATEILRPNATGDATQISSVYPSGTPHWQAVDEETADGDSSYVSTSSTSYQTDLYNLPDHTGSGTINGVTVYFRFRTTYYLYTAYGRAAIKTYGTIYNGTTESTTSTFYDTRSYTWTNNPYTGSSWTWAEIDALQAGLGTRISNGAGSSRCTQVYVQVSYVPPGGEAWLWTKVPSISSTADTQLYLYYDKNHVDNTDFVGDTGSVPAMNVWDNNFKGVYHLQGDPTPPTSIGWGKTSIGGVSNGANMSRAMGGMSPNVNNMTIESICIYLGAQTGNVRLAVYSGGQLDNPNGATLLWDAGTVNPNGVAGWYTINHPTGGVAWPANTVTWLAWKLNTGVSVYADSTSSGAGDFQTQRGRNENNFNQDPSVAFPSTYGQQGTFANYWYSIYVNYEGISNLKDSTSNGNIGTSAGSMTSDDEVTAQVDGGLDFDGSNDEIACENVAGLNITAALTIEAWAKTSSTGINRGIVNKQVNISPYNGYQLRKQSDNTYRFCVGDPASYYAASNSAYTDSNWHYIVGVKSSTNFLFVDGIRQTGNFTRTLTDSGANFEIGTSYSDYASYRWLGQVDEVRISNIDRGAAWIFASYKTEMDNFVNWIIP